MAIYHFSSSVISRSQGRSAVACSAYRSAEILHDEKYGKTHDYTRKQDILHTEILLPENSPEWMQDREKLWNGVELFEKRKDAQLAREIQFSLPRELSKEQNILLAREFIQTQFVNKGMVADWAYHTDKASDGELQPHVHAMLTLRKVNPEGFGEKVREWNRKEVLLEWREAWAETANRHLSLNGHDIQIDHRSNVERGIDLEPQYKIGTTVSRNQMARLEDHQRIARENGEKIYANPQIALDSLTRQQSTFTHQDLARLINRHTEGAEQFQQVFDKVKGSSAIIFLGTDDKGRERYTTQEMLTLETGMMQNASKMMSKERHGVTSQSQNIALSTRSLSEQQKSAFEHLTEKGDIKCVVGYAGSGKSYLLAACREAWEKEGYRVMGATLSGIAAENLEGSSGIESRTLASRMYYWDKGEQLLTSRDVLVIDEAGMIGSRQMARILAEAEKHHAKVVLVGDPEQLQAIEAGAAFRALSEHTGFVALTEIRRQREAWQREATQEFAQGFTHEALTRYKKHDHVHEFETQAVARKAMVEQWHDVRMNEPEKTQIMLAYTRKDVQELNDMAREKRRELGELGQDHVLQTSRGEKPFADHDRIYFTQNDRDLGVKNGTLGIILAIEGKVLTVRLDKEEANGLQKDSDKGLQTVTINLDSYNHIAHGYAATIHKSQGVTVDRAYLLASRYLDRHATYVGMSRHRESADLFYSKEEFPFERDLARVLGRDRGKDITLDYSPEDALSHERYARHHGIEITGDREKGLEKALRQRDYRETLNAWAKDFEVNLTSQNKALPTLEAFEEKHRQLGTGMKELNAFTERFERENPKLAEELRDALKLPHERRAIEMTREIKALSSKLKGQPEDLALQKSLCQVCYKALADEKAMTYLSKESPSMAKAIVQNAKSYENLLKLEQQRQQTQQQKIKQKVIEKTIERDYGLSL